MSKIIHIIDSGNTRDKVAIFSNDKIIEKKVISNLGEISKDAIGLYCSVNNELAFNSNLLNLQDLKTKLHFKTNYSETLGLDRFACAYFLQNQDSEKNICIIDAGSFITIDFIQNNTHIGGYIFPGLTIFLNTYAQKGKNLPKIKIDLHSKNEATSTFDAINLATIHYLKSIISLKGSFKTYFTGGDACELIKLTEGNETNNIYDEDLLFKSLYWIYKELLK